MTPEGADVDNGAFTSFFCGTIDNELEAGTYTSTYSVEGQPPVSTSFTLGEPDNSANPNPYKYFYFTDQTDQCRTNIVGCMRVTIFFGAGDHGVSTVTDPAGPGWSFVDPCDYQETNPLWLSDASLPSDSQWTPAPAWRLISLTCSAGNLTATVDTTGLTDSQALFIVGAAVTPDVPGGTGGVIYRNTAHFTNQLLESASTSIKSSFAGVSSVGDHIKIVKKDLVGNDADTAGDAVSLPTGSAQIVLTISNTGTTNLTNVVVTDTLVSGTGNVTDVECVFPDGTVGGLGFT